MKINTHKLLLLLYFTQDNDVGVNYSTLSQVVPQLSPGGLRSLVHLLKNEHYVQTRPDQSVTTFELLPRGRITVEQKFPFLLGEAEEQSFHFLILGKASSSDPHFRHLKKLLEHYRFVMVQRAVYVLSSEPSPELLSVLRAKYFAAVFFYSVKESHIPNFNFLFSPAKSYNDLNSTLSGISKQVKDLTEKKTSKSHPSYQSNPAFFSAYEQFFNFLVEHQTVIESQLELKSVIRDLAKQLFLGF